MIGLSLSEEQGNRLIERIEDISKNWKFEEGDIKERSFWNDYQSAYEEMINETSTDQNPWYVVPADDKKNMRLLVAKIISENLFVDFKKLSCNSCACLKMLQGMRRIGAIKK